MFILRMYWLYFIFAGKSCKKKLMGLFNFLKKKGQTTAKAATESQEQTIKQDAAYANPSQRGSAKQEHNQPQQPQLTKEERYGKYSLLGYKENKWDEASAEFQQLEDEGFYEASIALGQLAQMTDNDKAFAHFKGAAEAGLAEAQWSCAAILGHEYIPEVDGKDKEWYKYCLAAAQGGCCDAMNELGNVYSRQNDYLAAFYWYQMAIWYEHPEGMYGVGGILGKWSALTEKPKLTDCIDGVKLVDVASAKKVFKFVTKQEEFTPEAIPNLMIACSTDGSEFMPLFLAHFFEEVVQDDKQAKVLYQIAGHNNSIMGMKSFGDMLAYGKGCQQDMEKAFSWYVGSAEANEKTSCFIMGEYYRMQNKNLAAYWYAKAIRRGYEPARQRMLTAL